MWKKYNKRVRNIKSNTLGSKKETNVYKVKCSNFLFSLKIKENFILLKSQGLLKFYIPPLFKLERFLSMGTIRIPTKIIFKTYVHDIRLLLIKESILPWIMKAKLVQVVKISLILTEKMSNL